MSAVPDLDQCRGGLLERELLTDPNRKRTLGEEADEAARAVRQRGRRFVPSHWGSQFELPRAAWFDQVRASAAVHNPREPT